MTDSDKTKSGEQPPSASAAGRTRSKHGRPPSGSVLLVLAGPAGSGKTTLCNRLVDEVPGFSRVITATTRPPRPGETDGVHYHFLTPEQFDAKIAAGEFLEWACVHGRNRYGTLAASVLGPLAEGHDLVINVDVQGVENFCRAGLENPLLARHLVTVFISVPLPELRARMELRRQDSEAEIAKRLHTAELELREAGKFKHQIVSRSKEEDFQALIAIWKEARTRLAVVPIAR
jgi:guanylate kinase